MSYYEVSNVNSLYGEINVQGSKNSCLPMIAASILHRGTTVIKNCPKITDVENMLNILRYMGCIVKFDDELIIDAKNIRSDSIPKEYVSKIRSSVVLLGALIGRDGEAKISYPGGCKIGLRKIDIHMKIFNELGIEVHEKNEDIYCKGKVMKNAEITLKYASVGATENGILASVISPGYQVVLNNVAKEPEIVELCNCINQMGGKVFGAGTSTITIIGVSNLHDTVIKVGADRIVAGTYIAAVTAVGGRVLLKGIGKEYDKEILNTFCKLNMNYRFIDDNLEVSCNSDKTIDQDFIAVTGPYPEFPTDMQSQLMAVLCKRCDNAIVIENVFESRFATAFMLKKMGANIEIISNRIALINAVGVLHGTEVEAGDLRGGAALIIAGMMADNTTIVKNAQYIKRGYQSIEDDLSHLGVKIKYYNEDI